MISEIKKIIFLLIGSLWNKAWLFVEDQKVWVLENDLTLKFAEQIVLLELGL